MISFNYVMEYRDILYLEGEIFVGGIQKYKRRRDKEGTVNTIPIFTNLTYLHYFYFIFTSIKQFS